MHSLQRAATAWRAAHHHHHRRRRSSPRTTTAATTMPPDSAATTSTTSSSDSCAGKLLMVFDFDHTVVDGNTDTWIARAAPGGALPPELSPRRAPPGQWTAYMQAVLTHLHAAHGVTVDQLHRALRELPLVDGMDELLAEVRAAAAAGRLQAVIASDSNSEFIAAVLRHRGLQEGVFSRVYTNPASSVDGGGGALRVSPLHGPGTAAGPHACPVCPQNLCKTSVLQEHIRRFGQPARVLYVGDGNNDKCPALNALGERDVVFAREGFALAKALAEFEAAAAAGAGVKARVVRWNSGAEIAAELRAAMAEA